MFSYIDSICNDDNMLNVLHLSYTINAASNNKEFSFSRYYIHSMINVFDDNVLTSMNI